MDEHPSHPADGNARVAFWQSTGRTAAAAWAASGLAFVGTVIAARGLGPSGWGTVVLATAIATLVTTVLDISLTEALVYHAVTALERGDPGAVRPIFRRALFLDGAIGAVVGAGLLAAAPVLAALLGAGSLDARLLRIAALAALLETFDSTTTAALLVAGRPDLRALAEAIMNLVRIGLLLVAAGTGEPATVLLALAATSGIGALVQAAIAWRVGWRRWPREAARASSVPSTGSIVRFAAHSSVYAGAASIRESVTPVLVNAGAGPAAVGILRVAMLPVTAATVAVTPLWLTLFPEQTQRHIRGDWTALRRSIRTQTRAGLGLGIAGAVVLWWLLPSLLRAMYGARFASAIAPARVLLVAAVVVVALAWTRPIAAAIGRPDVRTWIALGELALTAALVGWLARHGAAGAAVALSVVSVVLAALWLAVTPALLRGPAP